MSDYVASGRKESKSEDTVAKLLKGEWNRHPSIDSEELRTETPAADQKIKPVDQAQSSSSCIRR
jgi:hypothetical protein